MSKIITVVRYSRPLPKQAMEELQKAIVAMKASCPDHYFVIFPEHMNLTVVPEDVLLDAGWMKIDRLAPDLQEAFKKEIKKATNLQILRNLNARPPRIPGKGDGKG